MKILTIDGSPRKKGNSSLLLGHFLRGALTKDCEALEYKAHLLNIHPCRGCLKCNLYKECVIKEDDWPQLSKDILDSDTIVIASPVYFHHLPGPLKVILDRFRSFIDVQVAENGLNHTPWEKWNKRFVLLLTMGSPSSDDAKPIVDLFSFMTETMGRGNSLETLLATGLQMSGQLKMSEDRLIHYYSRIGLGRDCALRDFRKNQAFMEKAYSLGISSTPLSTIPGL